MALRIGTYARAIFTISFSGEVRSMTCDMCDEIDIGTGAENIAHIVQYRTCEPRPQARPVIGDAGDGTVWDDAARQKPFVKRFPRGPSRKGATALLMRSVKSAFALLSQKVTKARLIPVMEVE
ncbi:MAG: hypothetical protein EOM62_07675 [Bacteroidia bacterium]|nr:hypothetical protein [Bacteroidia bacterium]